MHLQYFNWRCFILVIFCFSFSNSSAQAWQVFNTSNSLLPDNTVRCITIDSQNRKWIATDFGLAVFDDTSWTIYNTFNSPLPDNNVRTIAIDAADAKWIGTQNGGLTRFDNTTWTTWNTFNSTLPDNQVKAIAFDTSGLVWVGTSGGLSKFNGNKFETYNNTNSILFSNNITDILMMPLNQKMICTVNGGLTLAEDSVTAVYTLVSNGFPDNTTYQADSDLYGVYWLASASAGLIAYTGGTTWTIYNTGNSGIGSNSLTGLDYYNNNVYITSFGNGLSVKTGLTFSVFNTSNSQIVSDDLNCVTVDAAGVVWIGSSGSGLIKLTPTLLGENEMENENPITLFPNPCSDFVFINAVNDFITSFEITDVNGKIIAEKNVTANTPKIKADVSQLAKGFYFIRVNSKREKISNLKFVKN